LTHLENNAQVVDRTVSKLTERARAGSRPRAGDPTIGTRI
jgi:hypothetical protein